MKQRNATLFDAQSVWLVPLFQYHTSLRVTSAISLWQNRMWDFLMTLFVSTATLIMVPFLLTITAFERFRNGILISLLLMGYCGDMSIA